MTVSILYNILTSQGFSGKINGKEAPMKEDDLALKDELKFFKAEVGELIDRYGEGKFVVVKGQDVRGPFDNHVNAYEAGIQEFGIVPFLIRRLAKQERIEQMPALSLGILNANPY